MSTPLPPSIEPHYNQALSAMKSGQIQRAGQIFQQILQHAPNHSESLNGLGEVLLLQGDKPKAHELFKKAVELQPNFFQSLLNLGRTSRDLLQFDASIKCYKKILKKHPKHAVTHGEMGLTLLKAKDHTAAIQSFKKAIKADGKNAAYHYNLAQAYYRLGKMDDALNSYRTALSFNPNYCKCYHSISFIKKFDSKDDADIMAMTSLFEAPNAPKPDRHLLGFALGKAFNDIGDFDKAFHYYKLANELKFGEIPNYSPDIFNIEFGEITDHYTAANIMPAANANDSKQPIFIVGMPRSGTSLVEQIISSHSKVHGAGELNYFNISKTFLELTTKKSLPKDINDPDMPFDLISDNYCAELDKLGVKSPFITDKMPGNFRYLGLIYKCFPNATIIHCTRNPIDTCLSCYANNFDKQHHYSYNLDMLGDYYNGYKKVMRHWHNILPKGKILDINYEDLVSSPEENIKKLLDHCGLGFEEACLAPHKTKRAVSTASAAQVREPINVSSVERWRRYERHLQPLIDKLNIT